MDEQTVKEMVRARYGGIAAGETTECCAPAASSSCCGPSPAPRSVEDKALFGEVLRHLAASRCWLDTGRASGMPASSRRISVLDQQLDTQPIRIVDKKRHPVAAFYWPAGEDEFRPRAAPRSDRRSRHSPWQAKIVDPLRRVSADQVRIAEDVEFRVAGLERCEALAAGAAAAQQPQPETVG